MDTVTTLLTAFALSLDCFAVALAAGIPGGRAGIRDAARIALAFGVFQAVMPVLGWLAGRSVISLVSGFDHWVAFALLAIVGARMIREGTSGGEAGPVSLGTPTLLVLAVATSLDALAVGVSLALIDSGILLPSLVIGIFAFSVSLAGALLGGVAAERWGKAMEVLGGLVLIGIGIRILITHLA
ncbi:MAG TPA: manganese efflux pump MntP family protein [Methanomicrobiales archaeon]|jgi:putative Mn2+ efflux pump MntP|nr:manganese efflux pump MntP family protein [Methanomicrobiales archaeon]